ncbi:MAG: FAD:protein FMN transferase [Acidobacteriota bacterium]
MDLLLRLRRNIICEGTRHLWAGAPFLILLGAVWVEGSLGCSAQMLPSTPAATAASIEVDGAETAGGNRPAGPRRDPKDMVLVERQVMLMGSPCRLVGRAASRAAGTAALELALRAMEATESRLSTWRQETALSRLNSAPVGRAVHLEGDLLRLLLRVRVLWRETGGAFDPAVGHLVKAWDLRGQGRIPTDEERREALSATGMDLVDLDLEAGTAARLAPGTILDAGAFGKGAALAAAAQVLEGSALKAWSVDLGGQVVVAPGPGENQVEVAEPDHRDRPAVLIRLRGESAATSGNSERARLVHGIRVGHILDPRTGKPAADFGSVTVVSVDPLLADALSTALYVMGPDQGLRYAEARGDVEALFLIRRPAQEPAIRATAGMEARLIRLSPQGSRPDLSSRRPAAAPPVAAGKAAVQEVISAPDRAILRRRVRPADRRAGEESVAASGNRRLDLLEEQVRKLTAQLARLEGAGQAPAPDQTELARRMEILSSEIERLEAGETPVAAGRSEHGFGPAASKIYRTEKGVSLGGYGEMIFQGFDSERDNGTSSGKQDQFDLLRGVTYIGYKLSDRIVFNSEIEFEHASTDARGESALEFAYLDFLFNDQINARAGLLLIPMGFINEQHEPPTFLGTRRPDVERFLLPTTWRENGFGIFGQAGPVSYRAYLVNGFDGAGINNEGFTAEGIRGGRQDGSKALAEDLAMVSRVDWTIRPGLTVGGSYYFGNAGQGAVAPTTFQAIDARTRIHELHGEWNRWGVEARVLYVGIDLDDVVLLNDFNCFIGMDSIGSRMKGGYFQVGYDLLARRNTDASLVPFVRIETLDTQDRVPAGFASDPAHDMDLFTYGVTWRPIPRVVFKADYQNMDDEAGTGTDQFNFGMGWLF